ncbi:MAG: hypothetical protein ABEI53_00160 [Candidatus Magasanikbacteria bacterium]
MSRLSHTESFRSFTVRGEGEYSTERALALKERAQVFFHFRSFKKKGIDNELLRNFRSCLKRESLRKILRESIKVEKNFSNYRFHVLVAKKGITCKDVLQKFPENLLNRIRVKEYPPSEFNGRCFAKKASACPFL